MRKFCLELLEISNINIMYAKSSIVIIIQMASSHLICYPVNEVITYTIIFLMVSRTNGAKFASHYAATQQQMSLSDKIVFFTTSDMLILRPSNFIAREYWQT